MKCQFWTRNDPVCSNNGNVAVVYGGDPIGRICGEHVEPYRAVYPKADMRFEDGRLIHEEVKEMKTRTRSLKV